MKVLHLNAGTMYGGVETYLLTLAQERDRCPEMEPSFGLCFETRLSEELRRLGLPPAMLGNARLSRPWTVWQSRRALAALLRRDRPDVVVCHMTKAYWLHGPVARAAGIPVVLFAHSAVVVKEVFDKLAARGPAPDLLLAPSRYLVKDVQDSLFPGARGAHVYHPLPSLVGAAEKAGDVTERTAVRRELDTPDDAVVIVQASRLEPLMKGHKVLLEALATLKDVPGWMHWSVGGAQTPEQEEFAASLKELVAARGIADRVQFVGQRSDVPRLLAAADIYAQANQRPEGLGISFLEAMAAGLPVVTSDLGPAGEVVSAETGILPPVNDVPAVAAALRRLIEDPAGRAQMGAAGRERVALLSDTTRQIRELYRVLAELTNASSARTTPVPGVAAGAQ